MSSGLISKRDFQIGVDMAWHKQTILKPVIDRDMFPEVVKAQAYYMGQDGVIENVGRFVPISTDDNLPVGGEQGESFTLFTPRMAWDYVSKVLQGTDYKVESIGMIKNRSRWFMSIYLAELVGIVSADKMKMQFNASGGLDGSLSPQMELSTTRIVCQNTLSLSRISGTVLFRAKQTKNFLDVLASKQAEIEKAVGMAKVFNATIEKLQNTPCKVEEATASFAGFLAPDKATELSTRTRNTVNDLTGLFQRGLGNRGENRYDALNAVTELFTRGMGDSKKDVWSQYESSEFGEFATRKAEYLNAAASESFDSIVARGQVLLAAN